MGKLIALPPLATAVLISASCAYTASGSVEKTAQNASYALGQDRVSDECMMLAMLALETMLDSLEAGREPGHWELPERCGG